MLYQYRPHSRSATMIATTPSVEPPAATSPRPRGLSMVGGPSDVFNASMLDHCLVEDSTHDQGGFLTLESKRFQCLDNATVFQRTARPRTLTLFVIAKPGTNMEPNRPNKPVRVWPGAPRGQVIYVATVRSRSTYWYF